MPLKVLFGSWDDKQWTMNLGFHTSCWLVPESHMIHICGASQAWTWAPHSVIHSFLEQQHPVTQGNFISFLVFIIYLSYKESRLPYGVIITPAPSRSFISAISMPYQPPYLTSLHTVVSIFVFLLFMPQYPPLLKAYTSHFHLIIFWLPQVLYVKQT